MWKLNKIIEIEIYVDYKYILTIISRILHTESFL